MREHTVYLPRISFSFLTWSRSSVSIWLSYMLSVSFLVCGSVMWQRLGKRPTCWCCANCSRVWSIPLCKMASSSSFSASNRSRSALNCSSWRRRSSIVTCLFWMFNIVMIYPILLTRKVASSSATSLLERFNSFEISSLFDLARASALSLAYSRSRFSRSSSLFWD